MDNSNVSITIERYQNLLHKEERLSVIERLLKQGKYVSTDDLKIILEIKGTTKE